ncbi:peptide/nickel transport system permease protein [Antricoccus suffuscus]|uniref:Peptide/nickel transport system permease protein n=1 Tax=Antricoccus suffuscus TaxID=1629062 RepID=A0A2T0ZX11_9ACTN|nr:ABC transporter permease [Antricoccus suffuscus]PRZ40886.1 peptide/nickel transport system permease protein [Antricoccus suffuscus]
MFGSIILRRLGAVIPTLLIASLVVFMLVQMIPGDPAITIAGESATPEQLQAIRQSLGLNDSLPVQFWNWLTNLVHGDLGRSLINGEPVRSALMRTTGVTLTIVATAMLIALVIGLAAGIVAALHANGLVDRAVTALVSLGVAMPGFWIGLILVIVFALGLGWFPATGGMSFFADPVTALQHAVLPGLAMGIVGAAEIARQTRGAMIQAMSADSVRTHRAKGLSERAIVWRALKNCSVPILTIAGLQLNSYLGATVVIEAVFAIPGLGGLILNATLQKDYPIIQGVVLVMALIVITVNLLVDIAYRIVDPRIR